jgi:histidyl-tRNA synthetase
MSAEKYKKIRGTRDIMPAEARLRECAETTARAVFALRGYGEIITPTFEVLELYVHSTGDSTDIVEKEMYIFTDKKGRQLALRPEGTPGVVRAYIENNVAKDMPVSKFYYFGQMFRYERPQEGRYREFRQAGVEYFGAAHPSADAETIAMMTDLYGRLGVSGLRLELNSIGCAECRNEYKKKLVEFASQRIEQMCDDCKVRLNRNPMRILDCKIDQKYLIGQGTPVMRDFLCKGCAEHYFALKDLLDSASIDYKENPYMVRGLDYYTRTVFELKSGGADPDLTGAAADVLAAGGRYDYLIEQMGGQPTPAVGFALGMERTAAAMRGKPKAVLPGGPLAVVITADNSPAVVKYAFMLAKELPEKGIAATGPLADRSLRSQMRLANALSAQFAIIAGPDELKDGVYTVKEMKSNTQNRLPKRELIEFILKFDSEGRI